MSFSSPKLLKLGLLSQQASNFQVLLKQERQEKERKKQQKKEKKIKKNKTLAVSLSNAALPDARIQSEINDTPNKNWWSFLQPIQSTAPTSSSMPSKQEEETEENIHLPSFLELLLERKKNNNNKSLQKYIVKKIFGHVYEKMVGQEHVYEQFLDWILRINNKTRDSEKVMDICYLTGPSGCGKSMFLELFFRQYDPKKYKFVSIYDYKSLSDLFSYIQTHYEKKLVKYKRPEYRIQTTQVQFPSYIYIIEDIDIAFALEETRALAFAADKLGRGGRGIDKTDRLSLSSFDANDLFTTSFFLDKEKVKSVLKKIPMVFTSSYFKGIQSLNVFKNKNWNVQHIAFMPIMKYPIQHELQVYLETNGGDIRQAMIQYQFEKKNKKNTNNCGIMSDHVNIFTRIENLITPFYWQKRFPLTTLEDAIDDDPHLVFQYFLHIYSITPAVIHSYSYCDTNPYITLRKMMHDFGVSIVKKKIKKVEYDADSVQYPFLVKEQLHENRFKQFNRRQGWNQYHAFRGKAYFQSLNSSGLKKHDTFAENFFNLAN